MCMFLQTVALCGSDPKHELFSTQFVKLEQNRGTSYWNCVLTLLKRGNNVLKY